MSYLNNVWPFIVVLGIIIFFHEFGHFLTAKLFGMRVFIFSFGFGRRLFGFKWGDTDCRVSLVPLGGYVKLEGEPEDHLSEDAPRHGDARDFTARPRWQRFIVYLAGPFMNGVLTVGVLTVLFMIGSQVDASLHDRPILGAIEAGSPAEAAGLMPGDELLEIDGKRPATWEDALYAILLRPDAEVPVRVRRGAEEVSLLVHSSSKTKEKLGHIGVAPLVRVGALTPGLPAEKAGIRLDDGLLRIGDRPVRSFEDVLAVVPASEGRELVFTVYRDGTVFDLPVMPSKEKEGWRVGIGNKMVRKKFGPAGAVREAVRWTWSNTKLTFETLKRLLTAQISLKTMSGPLGIARISGDAAREGPFQLFFVVALLSLQVGILNLFPLAPLDGGHMAILVGESVIRRDFSLAAKAWILNAGAMMLFLLIGLVLYSDLSKTAWFEEVLR